MTLPFLFFIPFVLSPIKIILQVFPFIQPWHIATISILLIIYIFISEMKQLLYFTVKIFFHSILSTFFREVNIIGTFNIPQYGPVIFTSNHANQFMDSVVVLCTCQRTVSFLMAESSYRKKIVGEIAWAMGVVPVKRAQDSAKKGLGCIRIEKRSIMKTMDIGIMKNKEEGEKEGGKEKRNSNNSTGSDSDSSGSSSSSSSIISGNNDDVVIVNNNNNGKTEYTIHGINTFFTKEIKPKDKIRFLNCPNGLTVQSIQSDTLMIAIGHDSEYNQQQYQSTMEHNNITSTTGLEFDILKRIEQSEVYEKVLNKLSSGGSIGIFPEGGSHDRTDLLPLKAGVALIAYSALEKDGLVVPIVPVGLNYFSGHKIRGRVTVEYGRPIYIDPATLEEYKCGGDARRKVCNDVLNRIEDSLRGVIVSAPDYQSLKLIHTARRLYRNKYMSTFEKQDLSRRFAEGYKKLLLMKDLPKRYVIIYNRRYYYFFLLS